MRKAKAQTSGILTLLTDFGTQDHFVAAMKGVISGIAPKARIIDVTHDIDPFQIVSGAFLLAESFRWYPQGTVHVAIVDPGVGSARRPLLAEAHGHYFIAPDNGILALALEPLGPQVQVRELNQSRYWQHPVSKTFHGRDIFAPVAAHLAAGIAPSQLGTPIDDWLRPPSMAPLRTGSRIYAGQILHTDRFGNLITNFRPESMPDLLERPWKLQVGYYEVSGLIDNYAELATGELGAIIGSSGYIEIIANRSNAARKLGMVTGAPVELTFLKPDALS